MSPGVFWPIIHILTVVVMIFQFRALLQSSSANYYHPLVQLVNKVTNPLVNIPAWRTVRVGSFFMAGMIVSLILSVVVWVLCSLTIKGFPISMAFMGGILLFIKAFGYLLITLLLVQALCSWLPATRDFSILLGQATSPITAPVQRVIPPIGMIDISLMLILLGIYFLNKLAYSLFSNISAELFFLWYNI